MTVETPSGDGNVAQPATAPTANAGWYDDGSGRLRWWDGTQWTEHFAPGAPVAPPKTAARWFKPTISTWIVGGIAASTLLIAVISSGIPGFLVFAGLIGLVTALYVVITGRRSWAMIPTRKVAAITLAVCLFATFAGGAAQGASRPAEELAVDAPAVASPTPSPSPSATFTDEAPADPATVTAPAENAAVVIADTSVTDTTATALLATIPIKGKAPKTGYERTDMFGTAWLDVDRNGCDTRNDILARDLEPEVKDGPCKVTTGSLVSPYTAIAITFVRGNTTSILVQIDHVVSLSNAWQTGAQQLSQAQRISLANDPLNLLAVDQRSNAQKGAGDTATWLPSNKAFRCAYVARQVSVKATYGLWVTQAEHDAMAGVLRSCADERALTSSFTPAPAPPPPPPPAPVVAPAPVPVAPPTTAYYENCTAARAAGAAPVHAGEPGYGRHLDRDGDGVGCET